MKSEEIEPYVGRAVALETTVSPKPLTGILERVDRAGSASFRIVSADGEIPPIVLDASEIVAIDT